MKINIVLVEPEIPQNTGNIARTCAAIGADLHLVKPLGFDISEKQVKRAGLDYWDKLNIYTYENISELMERIKNENADFFLLSTKAKKSFTCVSYTCNSYIIFGPESRGLNEKYILENIDKTARIPMKKDIRSLNLSNAVAIIAYEALRQNGFTDLEKFSSYFDNN